MYKLTVRHVKKDGAVTVILLLFAGICSAVLIPLFPFYFSKNPLIYLTLLASCVFYAINDRLQTTVRKKLEVSVVTIVNQLQTVFLLFYGFTFFHNPFSFHHFFATLCIILGNILLVYKGGKFGVSKYIVITVVATFMFATAVTIDISIFKQFNLPLYIAITLFLPAIFITTFERHTPRVIMDEFNHNKRRFFIITGCMWTLAIFFSLRSFQFGSVTTIVPLQATAVLFNVIASYFLLRERGHGVRKIIAAILVIIGVTFTVI